MGSILQPYIGRFARAESASNRLDIDSIFAGCNAVEQEASRISTIATKIDSTSSRLDVNSFSIDGATATSTIVEYCEGMANVEAGIYQMTAQIRDAAEAAYNNLQSQLNYNAQIRDQELANQANRR